MTRKNIVCIGCPKGCRIRIETQEDKIISITNYSCPIGVQYARKEFSNPTRTLTTTVKVKEGELPLVPVKTELPISRDLLLEAMQALARVEVKAPISIHQVIIDDLMGTGVRLIATRNIARGRTLKEAI